ncbi:hypothetical protein [Thermogemmatispora tikiterensis]|uniref:Uncharacterized protein n=1 Tax=Thermogemmatispora tikiterensis TaxID=1825093 RepID=A0A328VBC1_9CHLR|nr:hypothetical protein [Thermogemmatispora tikiterensis]RAQ94079.1 hypothetical protein A4R35_00945 [Thermogemmatispora tikiterensis]
MSPREKALYHQIHPLKLLTDISAEIISIYYCWQRRLLSGLLIAVLPPVVASFLIMRLVDLEPYRRSAAGAYLKRHMTPTVVAMRMLGTCVTHLGAWLRWPTLMGSGYGLILFAWFHGLLPVLGRSKGDIARQDRARTT